MYLKDNENAMYRKGRVALVSCAVLLRIGLRQKRTTSEHLPFGVGAFCYLFAFFYVLFSGKWRVQNKHIKEGVFKMIVFDMGS